MPSNAAPPSEEENDNLSRSTKKVKREAKSGLWGRRMMVAILMKGVNLLIKIRLGLDSDTTMEWDDLELEGNVSEDDELEEEEEDPRFSMGMT